MRATAAAPRRAAPRTPPRPARPRLELVAPKQTAPPRAPFVLLSLFVVALGLLALLGLNTVVAEDAFRLHELERRSAKLAEDELRLRREVAAAEAPETLAAKAAALGLVPASDPVFLRLSDGAILGVPKPAQAQP